MQVALSTGEIARLNNLDGNCPISQPLTLQVISNIQPFGNQTPMRYRCMVSDGESTAIAVLSNTMIPLVDEQKIVRYSVLRIRKGNSTRKDRPNESPMVFLIVMEADVLTTLGERIHGQGEIQVSDNVSNPSFQPVPQQQQQQQMARPQQQPFQQQQPSFMSRMEDTKPSFGTGPTAPVHMGPPPTVHPIADLNPYHSKWTIRARVTQKSNIRSWNKPGNVGRLFSVNLLDESGEIRATTFTAQVDRFYPMFEVGKVYYVSNAQVKMARQQFSNVNNQYELTFDDSTVVEMCQEQAGVPQEHYDFIPLSTLDNYQKNHVVDVLAVVKSVGEVSEFTSKSGNKMVKRDIVLVDKSGYQVRTTLWGNDAQSYSAGDEPVVAFKGLRVGDFGGRTLSLASTGAYAINPDIPEAHQLRGWYDSSGRNLNYQSFGSMGGGGGSGGDRSERDDAQLKTMAQIRTENLGGGADPDYFTLKGTVVYIRTNNLSYPACPTEGCNRKVVEDSSTGQWGCEKCARSYPAPAYRYIFSINVSDETGQAWLQCFSETGAAIIGESADTMKRYEMEDGDKLFKKTIDDATFKEYKFRCKARTEQFNETSRVRITAVGVYPIDYVSETKRLSKLIDSYAQQ